MPMMLFRYCHQCRQSFGWLSELPFCKSQTCNLCFCSKCLKYRYGEDGEPTFSSRTWRCPKCRGICNCSVCSKRRQQPGYGGRSRRRHQKTMAVNAASASASKAKKKKSNASGTRLNGLGNVNTEKDPQEEHGSGSLAATADAQ